MKLTVGLYRETVECILNPEESVCEACDSELKIIGKRKVRSEMEYIPAKLVMKDYVQYVYKCVECGKNDANPYDAIYSAPVLAPVLTHSIASPSSVAWIMYQKYVLSVTLYRQERDLQRMGAADWLKPLYDRMHGQLLKCGIIMSDGTTWQVNRELGRRLRANRTFRSTGVAVVKAHPLFSMNTREPRGRAYQGISRRIPWFSRQ
ncbi:hypothetical protein N752_29965 [Desulforamulus aquiferis]|nr:IS66 family transposase zinc-finger binding domain-containing protein [Desulforamulus aquiferis]RYD01530.1 hypothetical protein N752_29965 [Desulforamulus aquiferis]